MDEEARLSIIVDAQSAREELASFNRFRVDSLKRTLAAEKRLLESFWRETKKMEIGSLREKKRLADQIRRNESSDFQKKKARLTEIQRAEFAAHREDLKRDEKRARLEVQHINRIRRAENAAYREKEQRERRLARLQEQRVRNAAKAGQFGFPAGGGAMFAGLSRLGGIFPNSFAGSLARQGITGGFIGSGVGNMFGGIGQSLGRGLGSQLGRMPGMAGRFGSFAGNALGSVVGMAAPLAGGLAGVTGGATFAIFQQGALLISRSMTTLTRAIVRLTAVSTRMVTRLGALGLAATAGVTAAGVRARGQRELAIQGLSTVAGGAASDLINFVGQKRSPLFSQTDRLSGLTQGVAFGLPPGMAKTFLPLVENAAAIFGEDVGKGLRSIPRAAFQGETELAEAIGLNLRERAVENTLGRKVDFEDPNAKAAAVIEAALIQLQKFAGGVERISQSIPGGFKALRAGSEDFLSQLGGGFSAAYNLPGRLKGWAENLAGPSGMAFAEKAGRGIGSLLGKGTDFLQGTVIPGIGNFLSSDREGGMADEMGSKFFGFIEAIPEMWTKAKAKFLEFYAVVSEKLLSLWKAIKSADAFGFMKQYVVDAFNEASTRWQAFVQQVKNDDWGGVFDSILSAFRDSFMKVWGDMFKGAVKSAPAGINMGLNTMKSSGPGFGARTWNAIVDNPLTTAGALMGMSAGPAGSAIGGALGALAESQLGFGNNAPSRAIGGLTPGQPGQPTPAILHGNEYVIPSRHVNKFRKMGIMNDLMQGLPGYALGGMVKNATREFHRFGRWTADMAYGSINLPGRSINKTVYGAGSGGMISPDGVRSSGMAPGLPFGYMGPASSNQNRMGLHGYNLAAGNDGVRNHAQRMLSKNRMLIERGYQGSVPQNTFSQTVRSTRDAFADFFKGQGGERISPSSGPSIGDVINQMSLVQSGLSQIASIQSGGRAGLGILAQQIMSSQGGQTVHNHGPVAVNGDLNKHFNRAAAGMA